LGVDIICTDGKTCNFDCVYCQLGKTVNLQTNRQEFVDLDRLSEDLNGVKGVKADYVTFAGMGEPTLAANLGSAIDIAKSTLGLPVAVFTNAAFIADGEVSSELATADFVIAKLDAVEESLFQRMNHPAAGLSIAGIIQGLQAFRKKYKGKLALDIMLTRDNQAMSFNINYIAKTIDPDQVQLNTPLRPCDCKPLSAETLDALQGWFREQRSVIAVYGSEKPDVTPLDVEETNLRHPTVRKNT
jgi:wyosine [tRNA(Phe)-imidazoG37] synthetase (radical SAM superfamily)